LEVPLQDQEHQRSEGQIPVCYAHKNTGRPVEGEGTRQFDEPFKSRYLDEPNAPLYPFGFGLTYTTFAYSDPRVETPVGEHLVASARVQNTGRDAERKSSNSTCAI
jgi:beta-glucosidase